jgi:Fe2+ or Zn2+ uptake regulation protein
VEVLCDARRPLALDDLYRLARRRLPRLSLNTVSGTLRLLREHGLLREWPGRGAAGRPAFGYRPTPASRADRASLTCWSCGHTVDVTSVHLPRLLADLQRRYGFRLDGVRPGLTARCESCSRGRPVSLERQRSSSTHSS